MAQVTVENQRLNYQSQNQKSLRADTYKNVKEATAERIRELGGPRADGIFSDDHIQPIIGRKILASSFTGSRRWYNTKFQDGMAIVREYHKPDFFITMTCNPKWKEITDELREGQTTEDRPELVSRVFKLKKDQLMKDLIDGQLLGKVIAHMDVIEFQKRGLPHCHILLILAYNDRQLTKEFVDSAIVAELPPSPLEVDDPQQKESRQKLQDIVLSGMVHGPCGAVNPGSPCMENGKCTKGFPKEFMKETVVDTSKSYAVYRRRSPEDGGRSIFHPEKKCNIDNSWIVPYNPYLSLRYSCHINIECCASCLACKYLFKYVTKGVDRAMVRTEIEGQPRDEIAEYQDLRSIGSSEAAWKLLSYPIADRFPAVKALRVHLQDQQQIVFDEDTETEALEKQRETELTAFFKFNADCGVEANDLPKYVDMPKTHVYDMSKKEWMILKQKGDTRLDGSMP